MPTITGADFLYGSALCTPTARPVAFLPCGGPCGLPGPHSFRVQRAHGVHVLCDSCKAKVQQDSTENDANAFHQPPRQ